jgi:hypothetical protein
MRKRCDDRTVFACSIVLKQEGRAHRRAPADIEELAARVDDVDATSSRAERLGATIVMRPEDIPGIARFTVIRDPLSAVLALMKPSPGAKQNSAPGATPFRLC